MKSTTYPCPACDGKGEFIGIGLSSRCKRCMGKGSINTDDFIIALKKEAIK